MGKVYLMNPEDGTLKPLFETLLLKTQFFPSPDGRNLAYVESSGDSPKRILKSIDTKGAIVHELGIFQGGSIYPIVWSPDGAKVAFERFVDPMQADQEVYVVGRDGTGLSEVYRGTVARRAGLLAGWAKPADRGQHRCRPPHFRSQSGNA